MGHSFGGRARADPARPRAGRRRGGDRLRARRGHPGRCPSPRSGPASPCCATRPTGTGPSPFTPEQFHYAFTNTLSAEESRAGLRALPRPRAGGLRLGRRPGQLHPRPPGHLRRLRNDDRAPLLFIAGGEDNIMPPAVNQSNAKHYRQLEGGHGLQGVPRALPLHRGPGRLGGGGRLRPRLGHPADRAAASTGLSPQGSMLGRTPDAVRHPPRADHRDPDGLLRLGRRGGGRGRRGRLSVACGAGGAGVHQAARPSLMASLTRWAAVASAARHRAPVAKLPPGHVAPARSSPSVVLGELPPRRRPWGRRSSATILPSDGWTAPTAPPARARGVKRPGLLRLRWGTTFRQLAKTPLLALPFGKGRWRRRLRLHPGPRRGAGASAGPPAARAQPVAGETATASS